MSYGAQPVSSPRHNRINIELVRAKGGRGGGNTLPVDCSTTTGSGSLPISKHLEVSWASCSQPYQSTSNAQESRTSLDDGNAGATAKASKTETWSTPKHVCLFWTVRRVGEEVEGGGE